MSLLKRDDYLIQDSQSDEKREYFESQALSSQGPDNAILYF